ncbi:MAG: hypothetical protein AAFX99_24965, partial [Myxococcota bacterium]
MAPKRGPKASDHRPVCGQTPSPPGPFGGAELHRTPLTWSDVILPDDTMAQLRELLSHAQHRQKVLEGWGFGRK